MPNFHSYNDQINNNNLPQIKSSAADIRTLSHQLIVFELLKIFSIPMDIFTLNRTILNEAVSLAGGSFASIIHLDENAGGVKYIQKSNGAFEKKRSVPRFYLTQKTPVFAEINDAILKDERYGGYNYMLIAPFIFSQRTVCILEIFYKDVIDEKKAADILRLISLFEKCAVLAVINSLIKTHNYEIARRSYSDKTQIDRFSRSSVALSRLTFASYVNIISELLFISCPCEFCSILWFDKKNTGYRIVAEKTVFERGGEKILSHYRDKSVRLIEQAIGTMGVISLSEPEGGAFVDCLAAPVMNFKQSTGGLALMNKISGAEGGTGGFTYNDQLITLILTNYLGDFYNGFLNTSNLENKIRSLSIIYSVAGAGNSLFETSDFERSIKKTLEEIAQYMKIRSCALAFYDSDEKALDVYSSMEEDISAPIAELLSSIKMDFWSSPESGFSDEEFAGGNIINLSEVNIFKASVDMFKSKVNAPGLSGLNFDISLKPVSFHKQPCGYMIFFDAAACAGADCGFILDESESEVHEFMSAASNILISLVKARKNYIKLNELEKVAARMERLASIGEVAAGVAHEIRNPLGGISLFATSLAAGFDDGDNRKKWLNQIIGAVGRIGKIVSSLLNFAREEIINKTVHDAVSIAAEAAASIQSGLPAGGGIKCSFYKMAGCASAGPPVPLSPGEKVNVKCDGEKLKQVFSNLAQNSFNAAAGDSAENPVFCEADIIFRRDDLNCRTLIYFCDNGPGVPPEIREKIFRPFFTSRAKGTGLGLAITQKIMEAHSGGIKLIDSGPFENRGKKYGAIFELSLPD